MGMSLENYVRYVGGEERDRITEREQQHDDWANAMWAEYQSRFPDLAQDVNGANVAVEVATEYCRERGERPQDDPARFLKDVAAFHRSGVQPYRSQSAEHDSGRTVGIYSGGSAPAQQTFDNRSDHDFHVDMQRKRGWYD